MVKVYLSSPTLVSHCVFACTNPVDVVCGIAANAHGQLARPRVQSSPERAPQSSDTPRRREVVAVMQVLRLVATYECLQPRRAVETACRYAALQRHRTAAHLRRSCVVVRGSGPLLRWVALHGGAEDPNHARAAVLAGRLVMQAETPLDVDPATPMGRGQTLAGVFPVLLPRTRAAGYHPGAGSVRDGVLQGARIDSCFPLLSATVGAVLHLVPHAFPFLAPHERTSARYTGLRRQMWLLMHDATNNHP